MNLHHCPFPVKYTYAHMAYSDIISPTKSLLNFYRLYVCPFLTGNQSFSLFICSNAPFLLNLQIDFKIYFCISSQANKYFLMWFLFLVI